MGSSENEILRAAESSVGLTCSEQLPSQAYVQKGKLEVKLTWSKDKTSWMAAVGFL